MVYKRYYIKITVLLVLLAFTLYAFYWAVHKPGYLMTSINLGLLALAETAYLVFMFNKTNRDLNRFFEAFRFHENTITFSTPKTGKTFSTLHKNLEILMREFQNLRTKTEKDKHFYLNTLNHIGTGLVVMADDGSILFSNRAIEKMLGATTLSGPHIFDKLKPGFKGDPKQ
jgi:PAS domain-containing protein